MNEFELKSEGDAPVFGACMDMERVRKNEYLYTFHADEERRNEGLSIAEVEEALLNGRILEDYPNDPRGP